MKKIFVATVLYIGLVSLAYSVRATEMANGTHSVIPSGVREPMAPINLDRYLQEVSLTESGLTNFFKCYNNPFYARRFLPSCFVHVTDLLNELPRQPDPWAYTTTVFSMFLTKLKGCGWTNAFALADLLEALPMYLEPLVSVDKFRNELKEALRQKVMMLALKDPTESVELLMTDFDRYHDMMNKVAEFQCEATRFLDAACDKLIWDPVDDKIVWTSFKRLGSNLQALSDKRILHVENCKEIVWSLVYSFKRFIDICGLSLKPAWYEMVLKDIDQQTFLGGEEVDPLMRTKKTELTNSVKLGYAQVLLLQKNVATHH